MRRRSNSLKIPSKAKSSPSISPRESLENYDEDDNDTSNSSDPLNAGSSLLTPKARRFSFKLRKMEKTDSKSSLNKTKNTEEKKKKLVLDLDETLIHTIEVTPDTVEMTLRSPNSKKSLISKIQWNVKLDKKIKDRLLKDQLKNQSANHSKSKNKDCFTVDYKIIDIVHGDQEFFVCERPNVREFLRNVCELFEVFIYTASEIRYAKPIIDDLCPMVDESHRRYGDSCKVKFNRIYKDLYSFNCPLSEIFIVDDNPENFFFWPKNTILCKPFSFDNSDTDISLNDENSDDDDSNSRSESSSSVDLNDFVDNYEELQNEFNQKEMDIATFIDQNYLMDKLLPILIKCASAKDVRKIINSWKAKRMSKKIDNNGVYFIGSPKPLYK